MTLADRCRQIDALILDVDGVLTAGHIEYTAEGFEIKAFHVRDGSAIKIWQKTGKALGILSGRHSQVTSLRAKELGITDVVQGNASKEPGFQVLIQQFNLGPDRIAYVGDDLPDVPVMKQVKLAIAPSDACPEAKQAAHWITPAPGGEGAVRSAIELILHSQKCWPHSTL
jgi:3-deoxy-D-manno-octulosonate 8-phosphate phosphatase (KDO 8-P phosphatase)